jgi:hypothetical protein
VAYLKADMILLNTNFEFKKFFKFIFRT